MPNSTTDITKIKIIHWNGKNKPWNKDIELKYIWDQYYNQLNSYKNKLIDSIDSSGNITLKEDNEPIQLKEETETIELKEETETIELKEEDETIELKEECEIIAIKEENQTIVIKEENKTIEI
tara:strand:- start:25 stop:393 length:369 start_codon:yes stop_codon:yes gene_type:complete